MSVLRKDGSITTSIELEIIILIHNIYTQKEIYVYSYKEFGLKKSEMLYQTLEHIQIVVAPFQMWQQVQGWTLCL